MVRLLPLRLGGRAGLTKLFFPEADPLTGTLLAFATSATGFIARPIGGIIFAQERADERRIVQDPRRLRPT